MLTKLTDRLSYANVIASIALLLALSGVAYAKFALPKNSVRSRNIVNGGVHAGDIAAVHAIGATKRVSLTDAFGGGSSSKVIFKRGPFRIVGVCDNDGGGDFSAQVLLQSTAAHTSVTNSADVDADFGPAESFEISDAPVASTPAYDADWFTATAPGSRQLSGIASVGDNNGGNDCFFTVSALG